MAGDSQTGGGGSVYWSVDVDSVDYDPVNTICEDHGNGRYHQRGKDFGGAEGEDFIITIRVPKGLTVGEYLNGLPGAIAAADDRHVRFTLPIEHDPNDRVQINIHWGGIVAGKGRKILKNAHVAASAGRIPTKSGARKAARKSAARKKAPARKSKAAARRGKGR